MTDIKNRFNRIIPYRIFPVLFTIFAFFCSFTNALSETGANSINPQKTVWNNARLEEIILSDKCYFDLDAHSFHAFASHVYTDLEKSFDRLATMEIPEKSEFETSTEYDTRIANMKNAISRETVAAMRSYLACSDGTDYKRFRVSISDITIGAYDADNEKFSEISAPDLQIPYIRYDAGRAWYIPYFPSYSGECLEMPQDDKPEDDVFPPHVLRYSFTNCGPSKVSRDAARLMRTTPGNMRLEMVFSFRFEHHYYPRPGMFLDGVRLLFSGPDQKFAVFTHAEPLPLYLPGRTEITESIYMDELHYRDKLFINNKQPGTIIRGEEKLLKKNDSASN